MTYNGLATFGFYLLALLYCLCHTECCSGRIARQLDKLGIENLCNAGAVLLWKTIRESLNALVFYEIQLLGVHLSATSPKLKAYTRQ